MGEQELPTGPPRGGESNHAAAGRALGLTAEEMVQAFGIVYSSVAGNHQVTRDASLMKRLQPGLAAQGVFDGADGFFRVYLHGRVGGGIRGQDGGLRHLRRQALAGSTAARLISTVGKLESLADIAELLRIVT